ncbi:four helix bundle protein [Vibrio hyugaensis]|uniref:four helix bundle protein n=1 Tax=Vibrio hyugaensis TaxID=1534743 RepID=UPI0005F09E52|nr:four helix bundle protein [Vibrio hyugaensis]
MTATTFVFKEQLTRSALSIVSNLAEGEERKNGQRNISNAHCSNQAEERFSERTPRKIRINNLGANT